MNTELLLELLEENGLELCGGDSNNDVWAEWLDDDDNRAEPTTMEGMLRRLGLTDLLKPLNEAINLGLCRVCVDDRALCVNVYLNN